MVLIGVISCLLLAVAAFSPVYAGKHGDGGGNKNAGCNQQKESPDHHYDADCDGRASENGGGGSGGGGKPCAGCVGKADNKHPPGQEPDENDNNKGYECDDNKGVGAQRGSGNPAHTGCRPPNNTTTTPPPTTPPGTTTPPPTTPPGSTSPPGSTIPPTVSPNLIEKCDGNPNMPGRQPCDEEDIKELCDANEEMAGTQVCGLIIGGDDETAAERAPGESLPYTGAAVVFLILAGLGLIGGGITAVIRGRKR